LGKVEVGKEGVMSRRGLEKGGREEGGGGREGRWRLLG
jgi:hypothetical protein